jgi:LPXTG-motif cell wall-anchored protein
MESETHIGANEKWENRNTITFSSSEVEMMGGIEEIRNQAEEDMEEQSEKEYEQSFRVKENNDGTATYIINQKGKGYDNLNDALFGGDASISAGKGNEVTIRYNMSFGEMSYLDKAIFKISGSKIIDSNADRVEGSTAIWEDPSSINVTLVGGGGSSIIWLLLGVVVVGGGGYVFWKKKQATHGTSVPAHFSPSNTDVEGENSEV